MHRFVAGLAAGAAAALVMSCAGWDNPVALADLNPQAEFEVSVAQVETLEEFEVHIHLREGSGPMYLREGILEIEHEASGRLQEIPVAVGRGEYQAHVVLYDAGEHHVHFRGTPEHHRLRMELGETEIDAHPQGRQIGPYWVELGLDPGRVIEGERAHIHLMAFDGPGGMPVAGLNFSAEMHDPDGDHSGLSVHDAGGGEYEMEHQFGHAGPYELHVTLMGGGPGAEAEFHIPIGAVAQDPVDGNGGGDGHGH